MHASIQSFRKKKLRKIQPETKGCTTGLPSGRAAISTVWIPSDFRRYDNLNFPIGYASSVSQDESFKLCKQASGEPSFAQFVDLKEPKTVWKTRQPP